MSGIRSISPDFPDLPLTCLATAEDTTTHAVVRGCHTVIDFWTTKCTRCPAALDKLDAMAAAAAAAAPNRQANSESDNDESVLVQFRSICCGDSLDGARELLEATHVPRWNHMRHYFMSHADKEQAKSILGFKSVPFYVVLNEKGQVVMKGNSKTVDFDKIPGVRQLSSTTTTTPPVVSSLAEENKENVPPGTPGDSNMDKKLRMMVQEESPVSVDRLFVMDEDF